MVAALAILVLGMPGASATTSQSTSASGAVAIAGGADGVAARGSTIATITASTRTVTILDAATLTLRSAVTLEQVPSSIVLSPDGALAYVSTSQPTKYTGASSNGISVIDTATGAVVRSMTQPAGRGCTGDGLRGLDIDPAGLQLHAIIGCESQFLSIWTIDAATLAVVAQAPTWKAFSSPVIGRPVSLASLSSGTYATATWPVLKCFEIDGCPPPPVLMSISGNTATALQPGPPASSPQLGPVELGAMIGNDVDGTLLILAPPSSALLVAAPDDGAVTAVVTGLGLGASDLALDPTTKRVYVSNSSDSTVSVIDLPSGQTLGALLLPAAPTSIAVIPGLGGYAATGTGLTAFDLATPSLVPSAPQQVTAKVTPIGKGRVRATISWAAPVTIGTSPIVSYLVVTRDGSSCRTTKTTCTITMRRQKGHYDSGRSWIDAYSFTVIPASKAGRGASARTEVPYPSDS